MNTSLKLTSLTNWLGIFQDSKTQLDVEIYINSFQDNYQEEYIIKHQKDLLPDWDLFPQTIIFIFFQCYCVLDGTNLEQENLEKDRLLEKFNQFSELFYYNCKSQNILTEIICPKEGIPKYSSRGKDIFNIPSIVIRHLTKFKKESYGCSLIHPSWGKAVYPCLILSPVSAKEIKLILLEVIKMRKFLDQTGFNQRKIS